MKGFYSLRIITFMFFLKIQSYSLTLLNKLATMNKKILIIGAGAIGGIIAVILKKNGFNPHIVVKSPELKSLAKKEGFEVNGFHGHLNEKLTAFLPSDLICEKYDIILLATKANDLEVAAKLCLPHLKEDSLVVCLQNGICEDELASIVGKEKTIGCVTGWGATMLAPGNLKMTSGGKFVIGNISNNSRERLLGLKDILKNILPVEISDNIYGALYSKLIINSCISTLGAISGETLGKMLRKKEIRQIFFRIIKEAIAVSDAMGIKVEPYSGKLDYYKLIKKQGAISFLKRKITIAIIGIKYRKLKSSSLQSLERGRTTEIDWFNGYIVRNARKHNISVPINSALVDLVKEIENGKKKSGINNLRGIFYN